MIKLDVAPVPKPRMTKSDAWQGRKCVADYWEFKDRLRTTANRLGYQLGPAIRVVFVVPMPKSWPKRRRAELSGQPHAQKPDLDNYAKALLDCLSPEDDSHVWKADLEKRWGERGCILIENISMDVQENELR